MKEPAWIDERDALVLHNRLLALHGGAAGLRDDGLLKSALARPQQHFAYAESADVIDMATAYTAGMIRNHPFIDGNKRTAFVVGILFLELNGYLFTASEEDAAQAVMELAAGSLAKQATVRFFAAMRRAGEKNHERTPRDYKTRSAERHPGCRVSLNTARQVDSYLLANSLRWRLYMK
jgi:death-on-curing protein